MAKSPYLEQPAHAFWRSTVNLKKPETIEKIHQPKFPLSPDTRLMTAGSCFSQHIHSRLEAASWSIITKEDARPAMSGNTAARFAYGQFSARYGNIYTARQLLELLQEASGDLCGPTPIWKKGNRHYDALRPGVEPKGLASEEQVLIARKEHLRAINSALNEAECFIFTLGLTEAWIDLASERCLPIAPGTIAGSTERNPVRFTNFQLQDVVDDLTAVRSFLKRYNPEMKIVLTVSPVPLAATATEAHVVLASTRAKTVLRMACDIITETFEDIDYFPSYEIITTAVMGGPFFLRDKRTPSPRGIRAVMNVFLQSYTGLPFVLDDAMRQTDQSTVQENEVACEEILLDMFSK